MKFSHIKVGERFMWGGEPYVKSTQLIANHVETGASKVVPKYINVELSDVRATAAIGLNKPDQMLEFFVNELNTAINSSTLSAAAKALVRDEIDKIQQDAMKKLK